MSDSQRINPSLHQSVARVSILTFALLDGHKYEKIKRTLSFISMSCNSYQRPNWHTQRLLHSFQGAIYKTQERKMSQSTKAGAPQVPIPAVGALCHCPCCVQLDQVREESVHCWSL